MKIRSRLVLLVFGSIATMGVAWLAYTLIVAPIDRIDAERSNLTGLAEAVAGLRLELNRLDSENFGPETPLFQDAIALWDQSAARLDQIKLLQTVNQASAEALETVRALRELTTSRLAKVKSMYDAIIKDAKTLFLSSGSANITKLRGPVSARFSPEEVQAVRLRVDDFVRACQVLDAGLSTTRLTILEQDRIIFGEIGSYRNRSIAIAIAIAASLALAILVLSLLMATSIGRTISRMGKGIGVMASGDLSHRFTHTGRDEITVLANDLNGLLESLAEAIGGIKQASRENLALKSALEQVTTTASSSAVEIGTNTELIRRRMEFMDRMVANSGGSIQGLGATVRQMKGLATDQENAVKKTTGIVQAILGDVGKVATQLDNAMAHAKNLVRESEQSGQVIEEAFDRVAETSAKVDAINEMADVIASIASQTNILAMNASIEAAHAGEFGKGFAVVAEEIGKLAFASAASSDEIAQTITGVISGINEAAAMRDQVGQAFQRVGSLILTVNQAIQLVQESNARIHSGSAAILATMENLMAAANTINGGANGLETETAVVQNYMNDLQRISHEVVSNIGEITIGLGEIGTSVNTVAIQAEAIGQLGVSLDAKLCKFIT